MGHHPCPKLTQTTFKNHGVFLQQWYTVLLIKLILFCLLKKQNTLLQNNLILCRIFILTFRTSYFSEVTTAQWEGMVKVPTFNIPENLAQWLTD